MLVDELVHSAVVNKEDNFELLHHGVKGMKWGVRKYKDERKGAKKALRKMDAHASEKFQAEQNTKSKRKQLKKAKDEMEQRRLDNDTIGSPKTSKLLAKSVDRYNKSKVAFEQSDIKRKEHSKKYNSAKNAYERKVNNAAKLPVHIKLTPRRSRLKNKIRTATIDSLLNTALRSAGVTGIDKAYTVTKNSKSEYTNSDRFAQAVRSRQVANNRKKYK